MQWELSAFAPIHLKITSLMPVQYHDSISIQWRMWICELMILTQQTKERQSCAYLLSVSKETSFKFNLRLSCTTLQWSYRIVQKDPLCFRGKAIIGHGISFVAIVSWHRRHGWYRAGLYISNKVAAMRTSLNFCSYIWITTNSNDHSYVVSVVDYAYHSLCFWVGVIYLPIHRSEGIKG